MEQGTNADRGGNFRRADHRLRAKFRIVVDDESLKSESRPRQKMEMHAVDRNPPSQSASDGIRNPVSQLVNAWPEQKQDQHESHDRSHTAPRSQKVGTKKLHRTILRVRDQRVSSKK